MCSQMPALPAASWGTLLGDTAPEMIASGRWLFHKEDDSVLKMMEKMGLGGALKDTYNTQPVENLILI